MLSLYLVKVEHGLTYTEYTVSEMSFWHFKDFSWISTNSWTAASVSASSGVSAVAGIIGVVVFTAVVSVTAFTGVSV